MAKGFTDWTDLGIFPLQDVEDKVPLGIRMTLAGGRVNKRPEAGAENGPSQTEYARDEYGLGTLGDVHPWLFWQTKEREKRAMGSWSMAWAGLVTESARSGAYGGQAGTQPLTRNAYDVVNDHRYRVVNPGWHSALPWFPSGMLSMVMPTTDEADPSSVMLNGDRRLVAPGVGSPGQCGTTVVDLQEDGFLCMDGSATPGYGGRHARLQSLVRVVALTQGSGGPLGGADLNSLALNYGASQQEGILGYGMVFGPAVAKGAGPGGAVTTGDTKKPGRPVSGNGDPNGTAGGPPPSGPGTPPPPGNPGDGDFASGGGGAEGSGGPDGPASNKQTSVGGFGAFRAKARPGHAIGFMSGNASGPIVFGCNKHHIGVDRDGHPMTSAHISTDAYFYQNTDRDGPLHFEGRFPDNVGEHAIPSLVHLSFDEGRTHPFVGGERSGQWRWWTTVPYIESEEETNPKPGGEDFLMPTRPPRPGNPGTGEGSPPSPVTPGGGGSPSAPDAPGAPGSPNAPNAPGSPTGPNEPASAPGRPVTPGAKRRKYPPGFRPWTPNDSIRPKPFVPGGPPTEPKKPGRPTTPRPFNAPETPPYLTDPNSWGWSPFRGPNSEQAQSSIFDPFYETSYRSSVPAGVVEKVGGSSSGRDVGLYSILHPFNTGFSAISFRPQLWLEGLPNFERNPLLNARMLQAEEKTRPSVLTVRAWAAQSDSGDWDYTVAPNRSRARGGTANGGLLIAPAEFEMEDYLGINSQADTDSPAASTFVTFAPKVGAAFGKPSTAGYPSANSKMIHQATAAGELLFSEFSDAAGATVDIAKMALVSGEGYLELEGTHALNLPSGTDAQQPAAPTEADFRYNTDNEGPEFYDGSAWVDLSTTGIGDALLIAYPIPLPSVMRTGTSTATMTSTPAAIASSSRQSGAGAPSSTPEDEGIWYVDTTADDIYGSVGTASSADWVRLVTGNPSLATKTTTYTILSTDGTILADCSGGAFTLTLPAAASNTGKIFHIKKIDASGLALTLDANGSETIDGSLSKVVTTQYVSITIQSDGSNWHIL